MDDGIQSLPSLPYPSRHLCSIIQGSISSTSSTSTSVQFPSHTELDSHANMVVLGRHAFIFESTNRTCSVIPFSDTIGTMKDVPIVDGAIAYDNPSTGETTILIVRNALHVPSMEHNLIPPFLMRESGLVVNDVPKIHCSDPDRNDHCIISIEHDLKIMLNLNGIFSYFQSRMPLVHELYDAPKVFLTPDASTWNPTCPSFASNEASLTNSDGDISHVNRHRKDPMTSTGEDLFEIDAISTAEWNDAIDHAINTSYTTDFNLSHIH